VQDARQAKATIDALGGQEGINATAREVQDYRTEVEQFSNGDRDLIEKLYKGNPDSTVRWLSCTRHLRGERNQKAIDDLLLHPIVQRLQQGRI